MAGGEGKLSGDGKVDRRALQEAARKQRIEEQAGRLQNLDVTNIAQQELSNNQDLDGRVNTKAFGYDEDDKDDKSDSGLLVSFIRGIISLFQEPPRPPLPWKTYRREEIENYLEDKLNNPLWGTLIPSKAFWYWIKCNKKVQYFGDHGHTNGKQRNGRGVCFWPDPSKGGGGEVPRNEFIFSSVVGKGCACTESYYGLWRADQPHEYGIFRWYDGDIYQGQWNDGEMQGYGTYLYSPHGAHPRDKYEGSYYKGHRQGTGVYRYSGNGGVYLGEWLHGKMEGPGLMMYSDGECYIGAWRKDLKEGFGVYIWGEKAGDSMGDKYEGQFKNGLSHGLGRTLFGTGGWHKGYYSKGKMNGFGVMQTAEGWEYYGGWRDDEMHHDVVCCYLYAHARKPVVQRYNMGSLVSERPYDPSASDWTETETAAREASGAAEAIAIAADAQKEHVAKFVRRAKQSQQIALDAQEEAQYYAKAAIKYKAFLQAWLGLKQYLALE